MGNIRVALSKTQGSPQAVYPKRKASSLSAGCAYISEYGRIFVDDCTDTTVDVAVPTPDDNQYQVLEFVRPGNRKQIEHELYQSDASADMKEWYAPTAGLFKFTNTNQKVYIGLPDKGTIAVDEYSVFHTKLGNIPTPTKTPLADRLSTIAKLPVTAQWQGLAYGLANFRTIPSIKNTVYKLTYAFRLIPQAAVTPKKKGVAMRVRVLISDGTTNMNNWRVHEDEHFITTMGCACHEQSLNTIDAIISNAPFGVCIEITPQSNNDFSIGTYLSSISCKLEYISEDTMVSTNLLRG